MTTPSTMADAYRIWAYSEPKGWDVTSREVADALDMSIRRVQAISMHRGWTHRMRVMPANNMVWTIGMDMGPASVSRDAEIFHDGLDDDGL